MFVMGSKEEIFFAYSLKKIAKQKDKSN